MGEPCPSNRENPSLRIAIHQRCEDDDQLYEWVTTILRLKLPRTPVCPGHDSPFDYLRHAYFEPTTRLRRLGPAGRREDARWGRSATLLDLLHKPGVAVRILAGSLEQSLRMWEHLLPDVVAYLESKLDGKLGCAAVQDRSAGRPPASSRSRSGRVRGLRVQKLRCDEVEMFDPDVWEAAQLITRTRPADELNPRPVAGVVEALSTLHKPPA